MSTTNRWADKAKELLVHYLGLAASGDTGDPEEAASIVDAIISAVHFEIERELKAALATPKSEAAP